MTENWNRAISHVTGDFVTFIGDDDAFLPSGVRLLERVSEQGHQAIAYNPRATYFWSDFPNPAKAGTVILSDPPTTLEAIVVDTRQEASRMLRYARSEPQPGIYHGIVARSVLDNISLRFGQVFRTVAPDTYLVGLLNGMIENHLVLPVSLSIHGKSGHSNSGRILNRRDHAHREEYGISGASWHPVIPPVNTVEAHVGDSLLRAYLDLEERDLLEEFFSHFLGGVYAQSLLRNPEKSLRVIAHFLVEAKPISNGLVNPRFVASVFSMIRRRLWARAKELSSRGDIGSDLKMKPCSSLAEAISIAEHHQMSFFFERQASITVAFLSDL